MNSSTMSSATQKKEQKHKKSKVVSWYMKAPIRGLCKARDFYVRGIMGLAGRGAYTSYPAVRRRTSDEDFRELVLAVAHAEYGSRKDEGRSGVVVVKSRSVVIETIDEEKEMEFNEMDRYPRSWSCVVPRRNPQGQAAV